MKCSLLFLSMLALLATAVFADANDKRAYARPSYVYGYKRAQPSAPPHELTQAEIGRQRIQRAQYNPHNKQKREMQARGHVDISSGNGNVGAGGNSGGDDQLDTGSNAGAKRRRAVAF